MTNVLITIIARNIASSRSKQVEPATPLDVPHPYFVTGIRCICIKIFRSILRMSLIAEADLEPLNPLALGIGKCLS